MAKRGTTRSFSRQVNKWTLETERRSEDAFRNGLLDFYDELRAATPVDTGNLRDAWVASDNGRAMTVTGPGDSPGISVDYSGYEGSCSGLVIGGNEFVAGNDIALYINGATNFVVQQNTFRDVGRSIAIGNSARGYIGLQSIIGSVASGTSADITVQSTCSHLVVENTLGLSGTRYALVDMRAPKSIVRDTYNLRDSGGAAVFSTATSVGSIIDGVISANDAGGNAVSAPAAQVEVGNVRSFGTTSGGFSNGRGGRLWWSPGNPATVSPDIRHYRGDVSMNDGTGSENGWRCTVAGVPGTWVSF